MSTHFNPRRTPQPDEPEILPEEYNIFYEGSTDAVQISSGTGSYDRRIIAIPRTSLLGSTNDSAALFILDGPYAGTAIPVAQNYSSSDTNQSTKYYLLSAPLPQGTFDFTIAPTYTNFTVSNNTIDTTGTVSIGLVLSADMNGVAVFGNTFKGDDTVLVDGISSVLSSGAIRMGPGDAKPGYVSSMNGTYNNANGYVSETPMFGVNIHDNTINGPVGGISISTSVGSYGRTYVSVAMTNNTFKYSYVDSATMPLRIGQVGQYSDDVNGTVEYDHNASAFVDPRSVSVTSSGNTITWQGVTPPATASNVYGVTINGTVYENPSTQPVILRQGSGISVDLSSRYNAVGITTAGSGVQGNLTNGLESLSSGALGGSTISWARQTFTLGPANANDVVYAGGQSIPIPQGHYTSLYVLAVATGYSRSFGGVYRLDYTDDSSDSYTQGVSDWMTGYTGPNTPESTAPGEAIVLPMSTYDVWNGTTQQDESRSGAVYLYGFVIRVDPGRTLQDLSLPNEANIKILAINAVDQPPQVRFPSGDAMLNGVGISEDGNSSVADINSTGQSLSSAALADASNWASGTVGFWNGQAFNLGAPGVEDLLKVGGQHIAWQGSFTDLMILADAVRGPQSLTLTVHYTGNTSTTFYQTISDMLFGYTGPGTTAPNESIAVDMPYYNVAGNGPNHDWRGYLYGYDFHLDPTKTVDYVELNNNANMAIFAMDMVNLPTQVDLGSAVDHVAGDDKQILYSGVGISEDNNSSVADINTTGESLSSAALADASNWASGTANVWNNQVFDLGPVGVNDVLIVGGQHIHVHQDQYTDLMMLAGSVRNAQSLTLTVHYTDTTSTTFYQTISDMLFGYTGPGTTAPNESIAVDMPYYNVAGNGPNHDWRGYLYGYDFHLDPTKTVDYVELNNNANMAIFAMDMVPLQVSQVDLASSFNQVGIVDDDDVSYGNLDGSGNSYSADLLGPAVVLDGVSYSIGAANQNDVVQATG